MEEKISKQDKIFNRRFSQTPTFWFANAFFMLIVHYCIYLEICKAAGIAGGAYWIIFAIIMTIVLLVSRKTDKISNSFLIRAADAAGAIFPLFSFWLFVFLLAGKIVSLFFAISPALLLLCAFIAAVLLIAAGIKQAGKLSVTKITIETELLPDDKNITIAHLTDLHLSKYNSTALLKRAAELVNAAQPDIIAVTGDVIDGDISHINDADKALEILSSMKSKYGTFAVTGNHDYYDDTDKAVSFMSKAGMRVLDCEFEKICGIIVAGVPDTAHMESVKWGLTRSEELLVNIKSEFPDKFILLLRHRPIMEHGYSKLCDLQLSGHTHGGQLFPLFSTRTIFRSHTRGAKKYSDGSQLVISNGIGYVGPPVRLMAPPEIVLITLKKREKGIE